MYKYVYNMSEIITLYDTEITVLKHKSLFRSALKMTKNAFGENILGTDP